MERRKLEMKRIENKRRTRLNKKARQLSILCDVDIAVVVFASGGKVYEYGSASGGSTDSVEHILSRYQKTCLEAEERTTQQGAYKDIGFDNLCARFRTCKELLESVKRLDEDPNELSVTDMVELEEELSDALSHTRARKTELLMEHISTSHEQDKKLLQENQQLKQQVASAKQKDDVDDGGGCLDDTVTTNVLKPVFLFDPVW